MNIEQMANHADTASAMATKATPPVAVTVAGLAGVSLPDLVLWATLVYTVLMIAHKAWTWYCDWQDRQDRKFDRRTGQPDTRPQPVERRVSQSKGENNDCANT